MKRIGALILVVCIIAVSLPALPLFADTPTVSISADRTLLIAGQETAITVTTNPAGLECSLSSSNPSIVTPLSDHTVMAQMTGTAKIYAQIDGTDIKASVTINVRSSTGLINGKDYYIMNYQTGKYLSLASNTDANNVSIIGRDRGTQSISQWTAHIGDTANGEVNYTRLSNAYCSTNRYMYASSSGLVIRNSNDSQTYYSIYRIESGSFQGKYMIRYGDQYVAMNSAGTIYLTTTSSANIYWTFMAVEKGYADLFTFDYYYEPGPPSGYNFNTTVNDANFITAFNQYGYGLGAFASSNVSVTDAFDCLKTGDIFIYVGHGASARLIFETDNRITTGVLRASNIITVSNSLTAPTIVHCAPNELALQRCVLYLGCSTGETYTRTSNNTTLSANLLDITFEKGAHFVLGTTATVYDHQINHWLQLFLNSVTDEDANVESIDDMLLYANNNFGSFTYVLNDGHTEYITGFPCAHRGDKNQYIYN